MGPFLVFLAALVPLLILDALWITVLMKGFYASQLSGLGLAQPVRLWSGILVWLLLVAGVLLFVLPRADGSVGRAALWGAVFGFIAYGVYDLTNHAFLARWPVQLVIVDIAWGTALCAIVSACAQWASTVN